MSAPKKRSPASITTSTSEFMRTDLLVRRTRKHFPRLDVAEIKIAPIQKGGSDRKFYRIRCSAEQALILVKYNLEREENRHYVTIASFLTEHRIRVPEIYFHDADEGLIWLEDLGEHRAALRDGTVERLSPIGGRGSSRRGRGGGTRWNRGVNRCNRCRIRVGFL